MKLDGEDVAACQRVEALLREARVVDLYFMKSDLHRPVGVVLEGMRILRGANLADVLEGCE